MTRILSQLLQASEPHFRLQLSQLERVGGHKNTDIKLTVEVVQAAQRKIHQLGLDKHDTTPRELYHMLLTRVSADDKRLERALRTRAATYVSAEANLMDGIEHALQAEARQTHGFSIKSATLKRLLKKQPPKRLTKALGYRSLDSLLRNENVAVVVIAALHFESAAWQRNWTELYKQLKPADFEARAPQVISPTNSRWSELTTKLVSDKAHTVLSQPELGVVAMLPLPSEKPAGMVIASVALAFHELNTIAAAANFIRASQVHGDFGSRVQSVARGKVELVTPLMPQAMPWRMVQNYFATTQAAVSEDIFGPYVQAIDFAWHDVEQKLSELSAGFEFWHDTKHVTYLHENQAVSFNIVDAAINACNQVKFEARSLYHSQESLWNELTLRYLDHASVEQAVASVLQPKLAFEPAVNK